MLTLSLTAVMVLRSVASSFASLHITAIELKYVTGMSSSGWQGTSFKEESFMQKLNEMHIAALEKRSPLACYGQ